MSDIKIDLDPKKILDSLNDVSEGMKDLALQIEESLGKQGVSSIDKLEKEAEKGSNKITTYFKNLGKRVKEDLKTAFDIGGVMGGLKLAKELGEGVKSVFDLEKAFDRLNTRLQLTGKTYQDFRKNIGTRVAATGQKLEDIMPGVESAAAAGNVKSPEQLAQIAESLGKARAETGEGTEGLSESVIEILKSQGKKVTADSFRQTLDALQATRVTGAFKTASEAGAAVSSISPYAQQFGLSTRELGGAAATASRSGSAGQDILRQLIERAAQAGGGTALNSILGQNIFKVGKEGQTTGINFGNIGKVDTKRFGGMSQNVLEAATGIQGAAGADLTRFIASFKNNMGDFNKVVKGSNETNAQFKLATNNLASGIDQFKEKTKNAGREIGDSISTAGKQFLSKDYKGALATLKSGAEAAYENKGTIAAALAGSGIAALVAGKGASNLLGKVPGVGGLLGGQAAKAAGIEPVYVTNAAEIGGGVGSMLGKAGLLGTALAGGALAGNALANTAGGKKALDALNPALDFIFKKLGPGANPDLEAAHKRNVERQAALHPEAMTAAVAKGVEQGMAKAHRNKPTQFSNASRPSGQTGGM